MSYTTNLFNWCNITSQEEEKCDHDLFLCLILCIRVCEICGKTVKNIAIDNIDGRLSPLGMIYPCLFGSMTLAVAALLMLLIVYVCVKSILRLIIRE